MGKWLSMTRSLSRPAHKVLTNNSSSSLNTFQMEKEQFEKEQMDLIMRVIENENLQTEQNLDMSQLRTALA